jgi:2-methylcitrate dehydratase PrpD
VTGGFSVAVDEALHDAKRLLLNQLKASAEAACQPAGRQLLAQAWPPHSIRGGAQIWWTGKAASAERAAAVNAQLLSLLNFGDTHLPSLGHFTAAILPSLMAQAEVGGNAGREMLEALTVGLEVAISCAPVTQGCADPLATSLGLGALAASCTLAGLDASKTSVALTALSPVWMSAQAAGTEAFERLGLQSRLTEIALHCRPVPAQALAPVDAVLVLRHQAHGPELAGLQVALSPQAWQLAQTGPTDLRHYLAAAWLFGQLNVDEMQVADLGDPAVLALSERIKLEIDTKLPGIETCAVTAKFVDGSSERARVDGFLGSRHQPLSDAQLSELFRRAADDLVLPRRSGEIIQALWSLDAAPDVRAFTALLRRP